MGKDGVRARLNYNMHAPALAESPAPEFSKFLVTSRQRLFLNLLALALYFPLVFLGYGSEGDTYLVLDTGTSLVENGTYVPSRNPGCLIHEVGTLILRSIGGSVLSNLGTLLMSLVAINSFIYICGYYSVPNCFLVTLIMILHPFYWVNSACTIDYLWALGFSLAGFVFLLQKRFAAAGLLMGLAIGSRSASFISVGCILVFLFVSAKEYRKQLLGSALITGLVGTICYLPSYASAHWTFSFLTPGMGTTDFWSLKLRFGRFVYKNIYFWGLQTLVPLAVVFLVALRNRAQFRNERWFSLSVLCVAMILSYEALFLQVPTKMAILLPTLPFWAILIGIGTSENKAVLLAFIIALVSYNIVNINIARPDIPNLARNASYGLWMEKGILLRDVSSRLLVRHCDSSKCFRKSNRRR